MSDIFISYKHDSSRETVEKLADRLERDGYTVWFDKNMKAGDFMKQIDHEIDECKDFVVLFDRDFFKLTLENEGKIKDDDYLAHELELAIKKNKNIIPVEMPKFVGPDKNKMPEPIREILGYHRVSYNADYYDGFYKSLVEKLNTREPLKKRASQNRLLFLLLLPLVAVASFFIGKIATKNWTLPVSSQHPNTSSAGVHQSKSIATEPILVIMGGGSVQGYIKEHTKDSFDISSYQSGHDYKYVYLPTPSPKAWSQIADIRSSNFVHPDSSQYHLILLSTGQAQPYDMIDSPNEQKGFLEKRGYVEEIKIGESLLQVAVKNVPENLVAQCLIKKNNKQAITTKGLTTLLCDTTIKVFSTNIGCGTDRKYDSVLRAQSFYLDNIARTPFRKDWNLDNFVDDGHPFVILQNNTYGLNEKEKKNINFYEVYDESSKQFITIDLYMYFIVYRIFGGYAIPKEVRSFLKDIGITMPDDKKLDEGEGLIRSIQPIENHLLN